MTEKFSQYDFVANIIPGVFSLFIFSKFFQESSILVFDNILADSFVFVVVAYVVGLAIQFISRPLVEVPLKFIFWKGFFYSEICLVKSSNALSEFTRDRIIKFADKKLKVNRNKLAVLERENEVSWKNRKDPLFSKACETSHGIYRIIDSMSNDSDSAKKAHMHNNYYSLLRGLTMVFVGLLVLLIFRGYIENKIAQFVVWILLDLFLVLLFLFGTKERAERYIKGLFYSIQ